MRAPRLPEIRSIFSILHVGSNYVSAKCNRGAVGNSPQQRNLELAPAGNFQEFLIYEESAGSLGAMAPQRTQSEVGNLNRYLLIFRRLILESRVRVGRPSLAAAPMGPEIRPELSASAASIISFSCVTRVRFSVPGRLWALGGCLLSQLSSSEKLSPSQRMTARSITFCSSRTFPGQP